MTNTSRSILVSFLLLAACPPKGGSGPSSTIGEPEVGPEGTEEPPPTPGPGGSLRISSSRAPRHFGLGPRWVFYCDGTLHAVPKAGGPARVLGRCDSAYGVLGDDEAAYFCESGGLKRVLFDGGANETLAAADFCVPKAIDPSGVYYIVQAVKGVRSPGVYHWSKRGGEPTRIHGSGPQEQIAIVVDGDDLWIASWGSGLISRRPSAGPSQAVPVVRGQKGVVSVAASPDYVFWHLEDAGLVRRRKKAGGAVEVVGRGVFQEPLVVHAGHAYWFEGQRRGKKRLMHLAPDAPAAEELLPAQDFVTMRVDDDGIFFTLADEPGIFLLRSP